MLRAFYWIIITLILLLGLAHSYIALFCMYFSEETLWFFGSGMAIIFAGLFNLLCLIENGKNTRILTFMVNLVVVGLFIAALKVLAEPQVYVGICLFAFGNCISFLLETQKIISPNLVIECYMTFGGFELRIL
jgi:hypothetical protein